MFDEIHDLPATPAARDCWVGIVRGPHSIICFIYGTSRASGCDLPAIIEVIPIQVTNYGR